MRNKQYIFLLLGLLCLIFIQAQEIKPNILFIAIDDLKPTVGAFGDDFSVTGYSSDIDPHSGDDVPLKSD